MTNKEIKQAAKKRLSSNGGDCIALMLYMLAIVAFLAMVEISLLLVFRSVGWDWLFDITMLFENKKVMIFWLIQLIMIILCISPEFAVIRRLFFDVARGGNFTETRQYISAHSWEFYKLSLRSSFIVNLIKFFAAVPAFISIYGIYYWGWVCKLDELTSAGLLCFMLCVGFTIVWAGVFIHYCMSLALTPYIMALNPKTNIFDACDLSVRLMDGKHYRFTMFLLSFVKFLPALLLVYPFFTIFPYFMICYILLMEDFLGDYRQDKMPAMIKRWRKYQ